MPRAWANTLANPHLATFADMHACAQRILPAARANPSQQWSARATHPCVALMACVLGRVPSQRCASESACRRCPNPVPQVIGATGQPIPARRVRVPVAIHEELKQAAMVFLEKWVNAGGGALECTSVGSGLYVQESLSATHSACGCSCAAPGVSELCAPTGTESS